MAVSQNGWTAISSYGDKRLKKLDKITGSVLAGDVHYIFNDFVQWFDKNVEDLEVGIADDWGFAPRNIAGSSFISNHASGTAIDLNAVRHPMYKDTMDAAKEKKIRDHLKKYKGAIRWGGDYPALGSAIDQMHFEINVSPAKLKTIVAALKKPAPSTPKPPTSSGSIYTVKAGDTLSKIGEAKGISWTKLASYNGLRAPYTIRVGQKLKLTGSTSSAVYYTVRKNDTLSGIATKYGTTWQKLQTLNKLKNVNVLSVGQKIRVK